MISGRYGKGAGVVTKQSVAAWSFGVWGNHILFFSFFFSFFYLLSRMSSQSCRRGGVVYQVEFCLFKEIQIFLFISLTQCFGAFFFDRGFLIAQNRHRRADEFDSE
jgi:hypothetical protein